MENKNEENKKIETKNEIKKEEPKFKKVDKKEVEKVEKQAKNKEEKKEKTSGKKMAWIPTVVTVVIVLIIATLLTVMIITSSAPKKSLDSLLTNLKVGDFEKAQEYANGDIGLGTNSLDVETQKLLFDKLEWEISKVTENDDNTASIEVKITTKNFQTIVNNYMQKALEAVKGAITGGGSEESFSSEDFEKYFVEELKNEEIETTTVNATINAVKENKDWKVVLDDQFVDAILPGLQETVNSLA